MSPPSWSSCQPLCLRPFAQAGSVRWACQQKTCWEHRQGMPKGMNPTNHPLWFPVREATGSFHFCFWPLPALLCGLIRPRSLPGSSCSKASCRTPTLPPAGFLGWLQGEATPNFPKTCPNPNLELAAEPPLAQHWLEQTAHLICLAPFQGSTPSRRGQFSGVLPGFH